MRLSRALFFILILLFPLLIFSQNPIYIADGDVNIIYVDPLAPEQNKHISFNITGESFFAANSTTNGRTAFVTQTIRSPKTAGELLITEVAGPSQRGNASLNGGSISNTFFSSQNAPENTNFKFKVQYAVPKLTPKETGKFIRVPFTMTGRVVCFSTDTSTEPLFFNYQIYGSGFANLRFERVRDFSGRHLRKVYLSYANYEFINQPFPE